MTTPAAPAQAAGKGLSKQIGPLPLGIWLAAGGAGIAIAAYTRKQSASAPVTVDSAGSPINDQTGGVGVGPGGSAWNYIPPSTAASGPTLPTNNNEWYAYVFQQLVAKGYDPGLVDSALRNYLSGQQLDVRQWAIIQEALKIMAPPDGASMGPVNPPPPTGIPGQPKPPPPGPKSFQDSFHFMGKLHGPPEDLRRYGKAIYPGITEQQLTNVLFWSARDIKNARIVWYISAAVLGKATTVPGGSPMYWHGSQANNNSRI